LSACSTLSTPLSPPGTRVLALDPLDADSPNSELIAISLQQQDSTALLTVDFLDLRIDHPPWLIVEIDPWLGDSPPGRSARYKNLQLLLTPSATKALGTGGDAYSVDGFIRAAWDFELDQVRIVLPVDQSSSQLPWSVQARAFEQGASIASDLIGPVLSDVREKREARLLLIFWDVFRGETPALALRSWNGAHSGPAGERFGLVHLLDAASRHSIPINLLGINSPGSLAGLEFLGKLDRIDRMLEGDLINLPATLPDDYSLGSQPAAITQRVMDGREGIAKAYGIPHAEWLALDSLSLSAEDLQHAARLGYRGIVAPVKNAAPGEPSEWATQDEGVIVLARPRTDTDLSMGNEGGLSISLRRALIEAALSPGGRNLAVLGGSLPETFWGDPQQVQNAFAWIAAHPWIRAIRLDELTRGSLPVLHYPRDLGGYSNAPEVKLAEALSSDGSRQPSYLDKMALDLYARASSRRGCLPESDLRWDDAWAACAREPVEDLNALRQSALADAWLFHYAAEWGHEAACGTGNENGRSEWADPDYDGQIEAVLWNETFLAVFDPLGGRLSALFACIPGYGVTTIIAPRASKVIGASDPSQWDLEQDGIPERSDPMLAGAYLSSDAIDRMFGLRLIGSRVQIVHPEGDFRILFSLSGNSIQADFNLSTAIRPRLELGLLIAPELLEQPGFGSAYRLSQQSGTVRILVDEKAALHASLPGATWDVISSFDSPAPSLEAEDPNLELPPGHFLPLPFIVLRTSVGDGDHLTISFDVEG
jgi:hypothetical protein